MPPAWLECEICGRTGNVIPCVHSERCQRGRCLICHTSILGQPQFYATAYDIVLTCDSCCNFTAGCVVKDEHIPALRSALEAVTLLEGGLVGSSDPQKRLCPEGSSSIAKRFKPAAATTPEPAYADDEALPDPSKIAQSRTSPSPGKEKSPALRKEKSPAKQRAVDKQQQQQRQSAMVAQVPRRMLEERQSQQRQQQQQEVRLTKPSTLKRPAPAAQLGADALPGKKLAMPGQLNASADSAKLQHQKKGLAQQHVLPADQRKGGHVGDAAAAVAVLPSGPANGSGFSHAEAAAAAALGRMSLPKQQQSGSAGSVNRSHSQAIGSQQAAKSLVAAQRPSYKQQQPQQHPHHGGSTSAGAAALASNLAATSLDAKRPGVSQGIVHQQAKPAFNGVGRQQGPKQQHPNRVGKSSTDDTGTAKAPVSLQTSQHQQSNRSDPMVALAEPVSTANGTADTEAGTAEASESRATFKKLRDIDGHGFKGKRHAQGAADLSSEGLQTKSKPPMQKPKPFNLSGIKVDANLFDDIIPDEDNIIPDDTNEQSTPAVQRPHWHAAGAVKPCRNGNARNQEWRGHATIDLDAVVELDVRIVPQAGASLPPLLEWLKGQQDTRVDGSVVTKLVMDSWATREHSHGSNVKLTANFSKVLVTLKERPFGQGKQLPTILKEMVGAKKYLRLYNGSRSVFFAPVLTSRASQTHNMELMDYTVVHLDNHVDIFEAVCDDRLGVVYHLKAGEDLPTNRSVQFVEVEVGGSGGATWDRSETAVKPVLKPSKDLSQAASAPFATDVAATHPAFGSVASDEEDDEDRDNWLDDTSFQMNSVALAKPGFGHASGNLGLGMDSIVGSSGFTAEDQDHVTHASYVAAATNALPNAASSLSNRALLWHQGLGAASTAATIVGVTGLGLGSATSAFEKVQRQSHGFPDIATKQAVPSVGSHGTSPTTPDQQQPPTPPVLGLQQRMGFAAQGLIANVLHGKGAPRKNKLVPSMDGLCKWFCTHQMRRITVHIHGTLVEHDQAKAESLEAWMTAQGATVTMYPVDPTPEPGHVNIIVVYSRHVIDMGMEGKEALPINKYLLSGVHVVSELFIEGLQQSNLFLNPQSLEFGKQKHWQFFASGVNLMLENTLLKYSKCMLPELMQALKAVSACMGPHVSCKAFQGRGVLEVDQQSKREGLLQLLPKDYVSTTPKPGMPQAVRDAIKAVYNIHKREETLRYMIIVVPDFDDGLAEDDLQHVESVLKASTDQKTIYAATISDTIAFLRILSCVDKVSTEST